MKRILYLMALICAVPILPACTTVPVGPAPIADKTTLDEKLAVTAEIAYTAAAKAADIAIRAGLVPASKFEYLKAADSKAYASVKAVRAAYSAGNAATYVEAVVNAQAAVNGLLDVIGR